MNIISYCVKLQNEFNVSLSSKWIEERTNSDWALTILTEGSEFIENFNWKWWKHVDINYSNAKLEAVDLFHFVICELLETMKDANKVSSYLENNLKVQKGNIIDLQKYIGEIQILSYQLDKEKNLNSIRLQITKRKLIDTYLNLMSVVLGLSNFKSIDELGKLYVFKNALNRLRQKYGYKKGTYRKLWDDKHEDNYYMMNISEKVSNSITLENALKMLEKEYSKFNGV